MSTSTEEFERLAEQERDKGTLLELWEFLKHTKKWWLLPIVAVMLILGALLLMSGSGVAPFIYTLF